MWYYLLSIAAFSIFMLIQWRRNRIEWNSPLQSLQAARAAIHLGNGWFWIFVYYAFLAFSLIMMNAVGFFVCSALIIGFMYYIQNRVLDTDPTTRWDYNIAANWRRNIWLWLSVYSFALYLFFYLIMGTYFLGEYPIRKAPEFREKTKTYYYWSAEKTERTDVHR